MLQGSTLRIDVEALVLRTDVPTFFILFFWFNLFPVARRFVHLFGEFQLRRRLSRVSANVAARRLKQSDNETISPSERRLKHRRQ